MSAYALPLTYDLLYGCDVCGARQLAHDDAELASKGWHVTPGHAFCATCKAPEGQCEPCNDIKEILER